MGVTIKSREKADGSVSWFLYFRPALPDGTTLHHVKGYTREDDREAVEAYAAPFREALANGTPMPAHETADRWYDRFIKSRMGKVSTADTDHQQWLKWISPVKLPSGGTFGGKALTAITLDDVEDVRDALDRAVDAWEAAGKKRGTGLAFATAGNVWSILTTAMKHASTRKGDRALRIREAAGLGNPCEGIRPPRRGRAKRRHWLRSAWLNAALTSPKNTDLEMKEAIAIGVGLHLRPGELHELRVKDLDFEAGEVRITRSYDEQKKRVKDGAKTDEGIRTVTIPDWLRPLLERIAKGRKANAHIAPWISKTSEHDRAPALRAFLENGGKTPAHVLEDTATHERVDFRSIRDTGITLRFLGGERAEVVQREAGHEHISTTLGYAKEVADKGGRYGDPFLTLPADLDAPALVVGGASSSLSAASADPSLVNRVNGSRENAEKMVARVGFEPTTFGL